MSKATIGWRARAWPRQGAGWSVVARVAYHVVPAALASVVAAALVALVAADPGYAHARGAAKAKGQAARALGDAYRAFQARDYGAASQLAESIELEGLHNQDYALYIRAQSAYLMGRFQRALQHFRALSRRSDSRFQELAPWREADCLWQLGQHGAAQAAYSKLVKRYADRRRSPGDLALARFRIADAYVPAGRGQGRQNKNKNKNKKAIARAVSGLRDVLIHHPAHPMAARAEVRLLELGGERAVRFSANERIERARALIDAHLWHESIAELALIGDDHDADVLRERDFWTATALFKMRRRYKDASDIFLRIYKDMGGQAARALFHGARALSRADFDAEAITWYQRVVSEYPSSSWAKEAQFLSGWLEFNMGDYQAALPHLEKMLERYPKSRYATDARWFLGFSLFRLGRYEDALPHFAALSRLSEPLQGGQGRYWHARSLHKLGRTDPAVTEWRALVERYPFSWYAHLARARLAEQGVQVGAFGETVGDTADVDKGKGKGKGKVPTIDAEVAEGLAADPLIQRADELIAAGLVVEAGIELRRGEKAFIKRVKLRSRALAMLMDRYRKADNFNRPWMLAIIYGGRRALDSPPDDKMTRVWWEHAYPLAYRELVERWRHLGDNPPHYLYAIMRKESGFDPHVLSYADAIGLLQMIPATTKRVAKALDVAYTTDLLYDPELNIKTGSWYIGRLLQKFKGQVPLGAGSFNSGPRPVMKWLAAFGDLPMDEFVETVPYRQTRGYMKKVTATYSRYVYLYEGIVYDQPLVVDREYLRNEITF